ncbi:MAG: fumarate hydratase [Clostridiales bacterium]|nr:fumarate hydratase [Clostridiales bacterium]
MREISYETIEKSVEELCIRANICLPEDVKAAFDEGQNNEASESGRAIFSQMKNNWSLAEKCGIPVCQDTGMAVVFCELGQDVHITGGNFEDAVNSGVRNGYLKGCLRLSVVSDPLRRVNTNDNTPAVIHTRIVPGDQMKLTVAPKGFGSENMSAVKMFTPSAKKEDIIDFIVKTVSDAGSNPCPPVIVGVGLGGTFELSTYLAKKALLKPLDQTNDDPFYQDMEKEALRRINELGIGPQGLGGTVTALSVNILTYATHIAGLPCAVNMGCHITRHAETIL